MGHPMSVRFSHGDDEYLAEGRFIPAIPSRGGWPGDPPECAEFEIDKLYVNREGHDIEIEDNGDESVYDSLVDAASEQSDDREIDDYGEDYAVEFDGPDE